MQSLSSPQLAFCQSGQGTASQPAQGEKIVAPKSSMPESTASATEPLVARVEMRLAIGEKELDVIEKGDLLTLLEEEKTHT